MTASDFTEQLALLPGSYADLDAAQQWAQRLDIPCLTPDVPAVDIVDRGLVLLCDARGLALQATGAKAAGAVRVDFLSGAVAHRRRFGGGQGQQIAKAVGVSSGIRPRVLDATAGLGRDAFVLATLGCEVTLLERSPVVAALLADGLQRAQADSEVAEIVARMQLVEQSAHEYLSSLLAADVECPQVVFLDPMFPERTKSAAVKKEMLLFKNLVGKDEDADDLLVLALQVATHRVVVKRPKQAPFLAGKTPSYQLAGKSGRFDVYALKKLS